MKPNVVNGAQKRKMITEEKGKMSKLPKLTSWFNAGATSATSTASSNIVSTSISTPASNHPVPAEIPKSVTVKEFAIQDTDPGLVTSTI